MLVFGIDVPLVEIILVFAIIMFILLVEAIIVIGMLMSQMNKTKKLAGLLDNLSETLLKMKDRDMGKPVKDKVEVVE
ncbi:hypothetical protein CL620_02435 [archaeon]|nr:hypothetical protein [archaeon]|tara:strand:- start:77 stop:307 length:231 start_codon:yes stop_codon:yes gene_type:complete